MTTPHVPAVASSGYLASSLGAMLGWFVLGGIGGTVGYQLALLLYDDQAGMANLALLLIPAFLGGFGIVVGGFLGTLSALRRYDHPHADETARTSVLLTIGCLVLFPAAWLGLVLLPGAPALARRLTLRRYGQA